MLRILKKNYILHDLHLHDSEGMFYGFWSTLRKRSRRICSVEWRSHGRHSPRFACLLALFTLAHIACLLHICDKINKFALLYLGPRPNNEFPNMFKITIYVVVQFCPWFKFYFRLFWGMVIYDNEFETKKKNLNQG